MNNDVRQDVFNALGEAVHTLPEAQRLLAPVIQKHGQQAVDDVLDRFYMVVDANMTGEKFISMKVEHSVDGDPDGEPVEDDNQDNRLAWTHPTWIRPTGMQQAGTCPECGREGWVSLETQDISLEYGKDGHTIRIVNGFMCTDCATFWTQTIVAKVGDVISNTVEGEATA